MLPGYPTLLGSEAAKFVACDSYGAIYSSDDGISWVRRASNVEGGTIYRCCYGGGQFVAGGLAGRLATSPDGISWTSRTPAYDKHIRALAFGAGSYLSTFIGTISGDNRIFSSSDAVSWEGAPVPFNSLYELFAAAYGAGLFVVAGAGGKLATSPYVGGWTERTSSFGGDYIFDVIFGGGLFLAGGGDGKLATSADAIAWIQRDGGFGSSQISAVGYGAGLYLAASGDGKFATSPDAITWTQRPAAFGGSYIYSFVWADGVYIAGGDDYLWSSLNGIDWTQRSASGLSGYRITAIAARG